MRRYLERGLMTQILIQTKGFDLTQALKATCEKYGKKISNRDALLEKVEFFLDCAGKKEGKIFIAKIKIDRKGKDLFIEEKNTDMYVAIRNVCKKAKISLEKLEKNEIKV